MNDKARTKRFTPARPDLAASHLRGKVEAARFAEGRTVQAARGVIDLRAAPSEDSGLDTQILFGEAFTVYEEKDGWFWGQASLDSYVGYAHAEKFSYRLSEPTHRVTARMTPLLSAPDVKKPSQDLLPLNAKIFVAGMSGRYARLTNGLYVFGGHIAPLTVCASDWVSVAEGFVGVPYLWGGKTALGLDCSGLIQTALEAAGVASPRDTDMMEKALGSPRPLDAPLSRGDLIFWQRHVGVMLDGARLLHADAHFMQVTAEPLADARARIEAAEGRPVRTIKRL